MKWFSQIWKNNALGENPLLAFVDLFQLALIFFLFSAYQIEPDSGIAQIVWFVLGTYTVIHFINKEFIPWFFVLLSVVIVFYAFGLFSGAILLGASALLFLILSPKYNVYVKILLFLILLSFLAFLRLGYVYVPRIYLVIPFVGSLFMFRGIFYLYYSKNHQLRGRLKHRLAYFFMFPNLVFLLFPIIDFKEFVNSFLVRPFYETRQKGIRYMLRGIIHLLLYRLIYTYWYTDSNAVHDLPSLLYFLITGYLLILRLSGILHMSMGIVCLFGYDLSPVFNFYFLGSSFTDLWRRINTYWRNFMQKVFFYPFYFRIRKWLGLWALPVATAIMFVFTWFFHNYQFLWLRGAFTFSWTDGLFWLVLGTCITINVAWLDYKTRHKKTQQMSNVKKYAWQSFFIMFCFLFMCLLWSLWGSTSIASWLNTLAFAGHFSFVQIILVFFILVLVYMAIFGIHFVYEKPWFKNLILMESSATRFLTIPSIVLLAVFPLVIRQMELSHSNLTQVLFERDANELTQVKKERGYYKQLIDGGQPGSGSWEITLLRPLPPGDIRLAAESTTDLFLRKLKPSSSIDWNGKKFTTNKFGIRDKEYPLVKGKDVYRIAIVGGSYEMGTGVADEDVFEGLVEKRIQPKPGSHEKKKEILNFSVGGYHVMQQVKMLEEQVLRVKPDMVILFAHSRDKERLSGFFSDLIEYGINLEYDYLKKIKRVTKVKQSMSENAIKKAVMPYTDSLVIWAYKRMGAACLENNIKPVWVFLPATSDSLFETERDWARGIAEQSGFETFDLSSVYDDAKVPMKKRTSIQVSKDDPHPNKRGHQIIANGLTRLLMENNHIFNK